VYAQVQVKKQVITVRKTMLIGVKPVTLDMELRPIEVTFAGNKAPETHTLVFGNTVAIYDVGQVAVCLCALICIYVSAFACVKHTCCVWQQIRQIESGKARKEYIYMYVHMHMCKYLGSI